MGDIVERLRGVGYDYDFHENSLIHAAVEEIESLRAQLAEEQKEIQEQARLNGMGSEREAKLLAQLDEAKVEIACEERRFSDLWEQLCSTQAQLAEERQQKHEALHREYCRREELERQLAEVTRERDDYKQAVYDLGLTPEEARAGAKRSRDIKQQLLATQPHAASLEKVIQSLKEQLSVHQGEGSEC